LSDEQQCAIATASFDLQEQVDFLDLPHTPHIAHATVTAGGQVRAGIPYPDEEID
jgi:hypothetical protein